jgi:cellulose biosynthesis protein BcsQ
MKKLEQTIIVGNIEFLDKGITIVHSIDEVYRVGSTEEQDALEDMFYNLGVDWVIIDTPSRDIRLTKNCLLSLLGCIRG